MEWQPIETAPKDGTDVDLYASYTRETDCSWRNQSQGWGWYKYGGISDYSGLTIWVRVENPTHWMPLPDAPK